MKKISEFLIENWILVACINILAIITIIAYIISQKKQNKLIAKENISPIEKQYNNTHNVLSSNQNIKTEIEKQDENIKLEEENEENTFNIKNEEKKQLQDSIEKITIQSNSISEGFDKFLSEKKIITDEEKENLEHFEDVQPIAEPKKSVYIDTDIKLPDITLSTTDEDIWN